MIDKSISSCAVFPEFSADEAILYFDRKKQKTLSHIDSLYYSVSVIGDDDNPDNPSMHTLISELTAKKQEKMQNPSGLVLWHNLDVTFGGFTQFYQLHLQKPELYDIFIAASLPTPDTPRIHVQLRTRYLIENGAEKAVLLSYSHISSLLLLYGLSPQSVYENRIDYAYHTNSVQHLSEICGDEYLLRHLRSKMRLFSKVGRIRSDIDINYFSLGNRKSNNIFFRCYDKTREVVEQSYKSFFIDRWLDAGMISQYDAEVLRTAYEMHSYNTGLFVGRIRWYLDHGHDDRRKSDLRQLLRTDYINSDNVDDLDCRLRGVLPPVTCVVNLEYQTKRRFYRSLDDFFNTVEFTNSIGFPDLRRIFSVLSARAEILDYLTSNTVAFVEDRMDAKSAYCDWWRRLRATRVDNDPMLSLWRNYDRKTDIRKARRRLAGCIAYTSMVKADSLGQASFEDDLINAISTLNDNDFYGKFVDQSTGEIISMEPSDYEEIRIRKARQCRGLIDP